jgi:hypothetical protein
MNMRRSAAALVAAVGMAVLAGCVSYAHHTSAAAPVGYTNPNTPAIEEVMMAGLQWTATRYPPGSYPGDEAAMMAVNLPEGVRGRVYERVAGAVPGAEPLTPENSHLPIYHVGTFRIRGDRAQVNVFRPVTAVGPTPTGETVYQEIRLDMRGGLGPWRVVASREWTPGSGDLPPLNYYTPEPPQPRDGPRIGSVLD